MYLGQPGGIYGSSACFVPLSALFIASDSRWFSVMLLPATASQIVTTVILTLLLLVSWETISASHSLHFPSLQNISQRQISVTISELCFQSSFLFTCLSLCPLSINFFTKLRTPVDLFAPHFWFSYVTLNPCSPYCWPLLFSSLLFFLNPFIVETPLSQISPLPPSHLYMSLALSSCPYLITLKSYLGLFHLFCPVFRLLLSWYKLILQQKEEHSRWHFPPQVTYVSELRKIHRGLTLD